MVAARLVLAEVLGKMSSKGVHFLKSALFIYA